jgi:hypothetical protein
MMMVQTKTANRYEMEDAFGSSTQIDTTRSQKKNHPSSLTHFRFLLLLPKPLPPSPTTTSS